MTGWRCQFFGFTLFAFLLNATLPFFTSYNPPNHLVSGNSTAAVFGERILICTGNGLKWVTWKELEKEKDHHAPISHYQCALCYLAANGLKHIALPAVDALVPVQLMQATTRLIHAPSAVFIERSLPLQSRAPPFFPSES